MTPHLQPAPTEPHARSAPFNPARDRVIADTIRTYLARNGSLAVLYAYDPAGDAVSDLARSLARTGPGQALVLHAGPRPPPLSRAMRIAIQPGEKLTAPMIAAAIDHLPTPRDKLLIIATPIILTGVDLGETLRVFAAPSLMAMDIGLRCPAVSAAAAIVLPAGADAISAATAKCPQHSCLGEWLATLASP